MSFTPVKRHRGEPFIPVLYYELNKISESTKAKRKLLISHGVLGC